MVWVVLLLLLLASGIFFWAWRHHRLPPALKRCLTWWLDLEERPVWYDRPAVAPASALNIEPETEPESGLDAETEPLAARAPSPRTQHRGAVSDANLPLIEMADVAQHLNQGRYRSRLARPQPDAALPLLDKPAIHANLQARRPKSTRPSPFDQSQPLPVIGPDDVEQNLLPMAARLRPQPESLRPLPVIDAEEVRASLQQIHGSRLKPRVELPSAPPQPEPSALLKASGAPRSQTPPPLVAAPPSRPLVRAPAPLPLQIPVPAPAPLPVVESVIAPRPLSVRPLAPCIEPQPISRPQPAPRLELDDEPGETSDFPSALVARAESHVTPLPATDSVVAPLVWHSIEEQPLPSAPPAATVLAPEPVAPAMAPTMAPRPAYDHHSLPGLDLLKPADARRELGVSPEELLERGIVIEEKLAEFKVKVAVVDAYAGPVITRYEVEPAVGVRGSQVVNLIKDLARALGLASIRVVETIPGKTCMGLELPNPTREMIRLSEILSSSAFTDPSTKLTLALGKDITGEPVVMDLARAPHLLVAGTTGSGKSVGVNAMILSLLFKFTPDDVRFIMIDPKMLELSVYNDIPHLLAPVVTDMKLAAQALNWCVGEMEKRYRLMSALGVRNLAGYNEKVAVARASARPLTNPFSLTPETPEPLELLPAIVVVVDEFADLMMVAGKKIEELIARLAQKARAAGIHLILATQRPSVDVITGLIKANIPTRVAFQVSSKVDSRTILDQMGAEALLGQGDMLYLPPGSGYPQRIHGAFVADDEVHGVVEFLKQFGAPDYVEGLLSGEAELEEDAVAGARNAAPDADPLYDEAVEIVLRTRKASISSVQRHLRIGYNRAARLIEEMEASGLVSSMENNGNRTVLVPDRDR